MTRPPECAVCGEGSVEQLESAWDVSLWRCPGCRSAFVWPAPDDEDLRDRYRDEHGRGKWEAFFDEIPGEVLEEREEAVRALAGGPGRVLDVGCGGGEYLEVCRARGWQVVGTEVDRGLASRARARSGAPVLAGYLEAIADEELFDVVTFWDVLEHVPEPRHLLAQARDRLVPGGVAVATMPNAGGATAFLHGGRWKYYDWDAYGHLYHLSMKGLETLFRRAGYGVVRATASGSTDLRDVPEVRWNREPGLLLTGLLDRASGLLARITEPLGLGNTLLVAGRKVDG